MNGRKTVWAFLLIGVLTLLAGVFIPSSLQSVSVQKAEALIGAGLIISSIVALVITS